MIQSCECECLEDSAVVFSRDRIGRRFGGIETVVRTRFVIKNRGVELFFGRKVSEDHCFRNSCCLSDLPGSCTAKTLLRKKTHSHCENLQPPLLSCHPSAAGRALNRYLLTQLLSLVLRPRRGQSKYLLTILVKGCQELRGVQLKCIPVRA